MPHAHVRDAVGRSRRTAACGGPQQNRCRRPASSRSSSRDDIAQRGWPVFCVPTATRENLLIFGLSQMISTTMLRPVAVPWRPVIRPIPVDDSFTVEPDGQALSSAVPGPMLIDQTN